VNQGREAAKECSPRRKPWGAVHLEVFEGDHSIVVKKSGCNNWERKREFVAGSNIHLKAEMEKAPNP